MNELTQQAMNTIEAYKNNAVIMTFVTNEALEKTAADIRAKNNSGTTAKGVALLMITNQEIKQRVLDYINTGLIGCYLASFN